MKISITFLLIICKASAIAQLAYPDSLRSQLLASHSAELPIYNGRIFANTYLLIKGSAYFESKTFVDGYVIYENHKYLVPVLYDAYRDEVLIKNPAGSAISLLSERVASFGYADYNFKNITIDSSQGMKPGFYQIMAEGKLTLLARRFRLLEERIVDLALEREFLPRTLYYIFKDGKYYAAESQNQLQKITKEKNRQIQQELKRAKIKFRKNRELALLKAVEIYNQ